MLRVWHDSKANDFLEQTKFTQNALHTFKVTLMYHKRSRQKTVWHMWFYHMAPQCEHKGHILIQPCQFPGKCTWTWDVPFNFPFSLFFTFVVCINVDRLLFLPFAPMPDWLLPTIASSYDPQRHPFLSHRIVTTTDVKMGSWRFHPSSVFSRIVPEFS